MSETPITVKYSLEEVLARIEGKVDELKIDLHREVNDLRREVAGVKIELTEVKTEVKGIKEDITELKGSSKAQIWTLIGILFAAVAGFLVAILKIPLASP